MTTSFTYTENIPHFNHNPSDDQPIMEVNNNSNLLIWEVDHIGFNSTGSGFPGASGGQHLQVTFNSKTTQSAPTDPISILYTKNGTSASVAQPFFINQTSEFPLTCIKALAFFDVSNPSDFVGFNIDSITQLGNVFTITIKNNVIISTSVGVFITSSTATTPTWEYPTTNTLKITFNGSGAILTFAVIQL